MKKTSTSKIVRLIIWVIVLLIFLFWFFELPKRPSPYTSYNRYENFVKIISKEPNMELYPTELLPEGYMVSGNTVRTHDRSSIRPLVYPKGYGMGIVSEDNYIRVECSDSRIYKSGLNETFTVNNIKVEVVHIDNSSYEKIAYQFYYNGFYYCLSSQEDIPRVKEIVTIWLNTL